MESWRGDDFPALSLQGPLGWMTPLTEDQRLLSKTLTQNIDFLLPGSANYSHPSPFHLRAISGLPHRPPLLYGTDARSALSV